MPKDEEGIGIIANYAKGTVPCCISTYKAKLEPTDTEETQLYDFDSGPLTFVLINAVKEQQGEIEALKAEIRRLKDGGK